MKLDEAQLRTALESAVPEVLRPRAAGLASIVANLARGEMTADDARQALAQEGEMLEALMGQAVHSGKTLVDFRSTIAGSIEVGDVAGRDLYNVSVTIGDHAVNLGERTALFDVESHLAGILNERHVDEHVLHYAAEALHLRLSGSLEDKRWALAAKLLRSDLASIVTAATRLLSQLCAHAGDAVRVAAPFACVDRTAAAQVHSAVTTRPARRGLGLNSANAETGVMYVEAACPTNPRWAHAAVPGGWGEDIHGFEDLVIAAVKNALGYFPGEEPARDELLAELQERPVVLLFTHPAVPSRDDLQLLRSHGLAGVSFFILAGRDISRAAFEKLGYAEVDYLPELDAAREDSDRQTIRRAVRDARRACATSGRA